LEPGEGEFMARIIRALFTITYGILGTLAMPLIIPLIIYVRFKRKKPLGFFNERMGLIPSSPSGKKIIWLHAVSVGETLSLQALIAELKAADPHNYIYMTTGTTSGKRMAEQFCNADQVALLPFDFIIPMGIAWQRIKPSAVIIAESELWPILLMLPHLFNIPTYSVSRRKTTKATPWLQRFPFLFRFLLNTFTKIYLQHKSDSDFFTSLGVDSNKLSIMGDLKSWNVLQKKMLHHIPQVSKDQHAPIIMSGSIHPGEITTVMSAYQTVRTTEPSARLMLIPRHFHWMEQLTEICKHSGLSWQMLTQNSLSTIDKAHRENKLPSITIVAELGVMFDLYRYADLFILGGTFVPVGGHNLLEPATWSIPSVVGPHHQNVAHIVAAHQTTHAVAVAHNGDELATWCINELTNPTERTLHGATLHNWLVSESKPVKQTINELITSLL
jgi:3-deoxy-D-manno-octulosonic-acid transferase